MKSKFKVSFEVEIEFDENKMTEAQAIAEVTESMWFPCEDTTNVTIIEQSTVERKRSATKKSRQTKEALPL